MANYRSQSGMRFGRSRNNAAAGKGRKAAAHARALTERQKRRAASFSTEGCRLLAQALMEKVALDFVDGEKARLAAAKEHRAPSRHERALIAKRDESEAFILKSPAYELFTEISREGLLSSCARAAREAAGM